MDARRVNPTGKIRNACELLQIQSRGRRDGRRNYPAASDSMVPHELARLESAAAGRFAELAADWERVDANLRGQYCGLVNELGERIGPSVAIANRDLRASEQDLDELELLIKAAKRQLSKPKLDGNGYRIREPRIGLGLYRAAIGVVTGAEFVLNGVIFRLFGDNEVATFVTSAGLTTAVIASAHIGGVLLADDEATVRDRSIFATITTVSVAGMFAFAVVREKYLEFGASSATSISFNGHTISIPLPGGGTIALGHWLGPAVFTAANALIWLAALGLTYLAYDPRLREVHRLARERWTARWRRWRSRQRRGKVLAELAAILKRIDAIGAAREGLFGAYGRSIERELHRHAQLWRAYAASNVRARRRRAQAGIPGLERELAAAIPRCFEAALPEPDCNGARRQIEQILRDRWSPRGWLPTDYGRTLEGGQS
jgi:hypothetical protein